MADTPIYFGSYVQRGNELEFNHAPDGTTKVPREIGRRDSEGTVLFLKVAGIEEKYTRTPPDGIQVEERNVLSEMFEQYLWKMKAKVNGH